MSSPQANQIDVYGIEDRLRKADKEAYQYIHKLKEHNDRQQEIISKCLGKLRKNHEI